MTILFTPQILFLAYDCPLIDRIYDFVTQVAGSSMAAVDAVLNGAKFAINWSGGWHHAQRDKASGFCYVNDIVIGISKLRSKFQKVLYIDLDVHHGNAGYGLGIRLTFAFAFYSFFQVTEWKTPSVPANM